MGFFLHLPKQDIKNMVKLSWKTEKRLIKDLMLSDINPRKISPEQKEALTKSLEKFNLADIPVLNTDNAIISGNQRLQILYDLGKGNEEIDVRVPNRKLSEAELKEYMLIANTHAGVFDVELLEAHFEDVNIDFDIQLVDDNGKITVKGHERVKQGLIEDDEVPEPPKIAKSKPGQIFILGMHRLMCGDSTKKEDVELLMAGKKADMVFSDPPYNTGMCNKKNSGSTRLNHIFEDNYSGAEWEAFLEAFLEAYDYNTKENCAIYICLNWKRSHELVLKAKKRFTFSNLIIWDKIIHGLGSDYQYTHEFIHLFKKGKPKIDSHIGDREYQDVWRIQRKMGKDEDHATKKPIELCNRAISHASLRNNLILDLFGGSGSTLISCEELERICYMMEKEPIYIDVIIKRWQDFTGQKAILESTGQEFDSFN